MKTILDFNFKVIYFTLTICFFVNQTIHSQWLLANTGLPTSGAGSSGFASLAESSTGLYMGSLDGELYFNNFNTGITKSWTHINGPSGAISALTNICATGSDVYVAWNNNIYLSTNNGSSWVATPIETNFNPSGTPPLICGGLDLQLFATDGTYFYFIINSISANTGTIYRTPVGSTSAPTVLNTYPTQVNCLYYYNTKLYIGTNSSIGSGPYAGLHSTSSSTVSAPWSDEFAGTPYEGVEIDQFVNTQYSTSYPTGGGTGCESYPPTIYYPFYMTSPDGASGTQFIQMVEQRYRHYATFPHSSCPDCPANSCLPYTWLSTYSYTENSRAAFPSDISCNEQFVAASGGVPAPTAAAAKVWGITTQGPSYGELGSYVNTSTWSPGTGGVSGLPLITSVFVQSALGSHNTYDGVSGYIFLTLDETASGPGLVYAESYSAAKTGGDAPDYGSIITPTFTALDNSLNLFPNPASNKVTFDLSILQSSNFSLSIYDQLGRVIAIPASNSYLDEGVLKLDVDLSEFPTGIYFYKLNADKEYSGKFIKQ